VRGEAGVQGVEFRLPSDCRDLDYQATYDQDCGITVGERMGSRDLFSSKCRPSPPSGPVYTDKGQIHVMSVKMLNDKMPN
jgi:hypothetical protein